MSGKPRLLFVSPRFLFPTNEGGKIRTANTLRGLKGGAFEIILASPAPPDVAVFADDIAGACDRFVSWPAHAATRMDRVLALLDSVPVSVATDRSAAGSAVIAKALAENPEVVVCDFPHADVLFPRRIPGATVLFTHNVEAEIFERHARVTTGLWGLVWRNQARKMDRFEREVCRRYASVIAVSARDAKALKARFDLPLVEEIETGVDLEFFTFRAPEMAPAVPADGGTIVFTGVLDSPANIDGVDFLMTEVWPLIARRRPNARAIMVGRKPAESLRETARKNNLPFTFTGFVDDIRPHVTGGDVSVIPLRVGSGTRIKAFESMAMGIPVVSTRIGIEGLDIDSEEHFLAADTAEDFAAAILRLLDDQALRHRLVTAARARLEARFSWRQIARQFEDICLRAMKA